MSHVILGEAGSRAVALDVDVLLRTRLLVQANSGGGKSWLLRRLAEQMFGKVQVLVIDPEGEFATLRERFGYVLVGKGGETPADPRSAVLVAHRLLELHASAVCDIFELKPAERHRWVKLFLEALIDAPKKLWHPAVVVVDEAHLFAPEKGAGESEASSAMVDLATRGRKRGFAAVFATQRLGKLRKDAAAELANVLVGRTFIDVDRDRAADALGVSKAERQEFFARIRVMDDGHFYALGRAIATERVLLKVGAVQTTHPEPGSTKHAAAAPPTPEKVKALLPKLSDLLKEAEAKAQSEAELRAEVRRLERELREARAAAPAAEVKTVEVPVIRPAELKRAEDLVAKLDVVAGAVGDLAGRLRDESASIKASLARATEARQATPASGAGARQAAQQRAASAPPMLRSPGTNRDSSRTTAGGDALPSGERVVLTAVAQHPDGVTREQLTVLTAYKRSTRDAYIQRLREKRLVDSSGERILATEGGVAALGPNFEPLPTGDALREHWLGHLPEGERRILQILCEAYPRAVDREVLSEMTGYARSSRDAYLQRLGARRLVDSAGRGQVCAAKELFG